MASDDFPKSPIQRMNSSESLTSEKSRVTMENRIYSGFKPQSCGKNSQDDQTQGSQGSSECHQIQENLTAIIKERDSLRAQLEVQKNRCLLEKDKWRCCRSTCYHFSKVKKSWEESKNSCISLGAKLLKLESRDEQDFIRTQLSSDYWIALLLKVEGSRDWKWLDGSPPGGFLNISVPFKNTTQSCGVMENTAHIVASNCCTEHLYICKKTIKVTIE
ncbi:natural killer cells antigen CD94-like [Tachyglossus aculeatus]|uniref:natural killer cells antigen CD94-like n=1 Tax=Tachyglossus aculeatus TaxID=9261 RepID=UPI0018F4764D|nr:natural killer cells antigen CD94-like [Tachyglossus aculeatus]